MKKNILSLFIFTFFTMNLNAQDKMSIGFSISHNNNSLLAKNGETSVLGIEISTNEKNSLNNSIGFSLWADFMLKNRISFLTGIDICSYKINQNTTGLVFGTDIDPVSGIITMSELKSKIPHTYIGIPLAIKLKVNKSDNDDTFFVATGLEPTAIFAGRESATIFYGNGTTETLSKIDSELNAFSLLTILHFGYSKQLSRKFSISLTASTKISIMDKGERYVRENENRYFSFGGALGLAYNLF